MMNQATLAVSERIARHVASLPVVGDADHKLRALLEAEYRRRLSRYSLTDRLLREKYGLSFEEFERQKITAQRNYSWEVESDAVEWDLAISGLQTMQRRLTELSE
jgi:hypothetical protein